MMKRKIGLIILLSFLIWIIPCKPVIGTEYIKAFYPLYSDIKTVYIKERVNFKNCEDANKFLEDIMKYPKVDNLIAPLPESVKINNIEVHESSGLLKIDFSKELILEMNLGTALETEIIKSIVNTLGDFYNVQYIYISVDGKAYESGHYITPEEGFKVELECIEEL